MFIEEDEIEGVVEDVIYSNPDTGYNVLSVDAGEMITVVGMLPSIYSGENIHAYGKWISHATYGRQFVCEDIEKGFPSEQVGILKFLSSGAVKGVGKVTAKKLVDAFGKDTLDIIENEPLRMTSIRGITADKALEISDRFRMTVGMREILMYLSEFNIPPAVAIRVYRQYGGFTQNVLESDPYKLWDEVEGVTFQMADGIATSLHFDVLCEQRVFAHIKYVLRHNLQNGHTFLPYQKLFDIVRQMLDTDAETVQIAFENMCERKILKRIPVQKVDAVYLYEYYVSEKYIADRLAQTENVPEDDISDMEAIIDGLEEKFGIRYADKQRLAIRGAVEHSAMLLTGGPGTGKTTTLRGIIELLERLHIKLALCAPTGRAAKRMSELCGRPAQTIHRLLEVDAAHRETYARNEQDPLNVDAVVVDETSMVDVRLFEALLRAMRPRTKLILVGDADQLPSVGAGNVFRDVLRSGRIFTVELTEIFRQASESRIVVNAHRIDQGKMPILENSDDFFFVSKSGGDAIAGAVIKLATERIPAVYGQSVLDGVQIITPTKKTTAGTVALNEAIREKIGVAGQDKSCKQGGRTFCVGDKVMQIRNNYDIVYTRRDGKEETGIFNGDIGYITDISHKDKTLRIRFDERDAVYPFENLDELDFAYAITVHKSQGSEFDVVVLALAEGTPLLQYRNLLYTAITRAKKLLLVVGSAAVIEKMVQNDKQTNRFSGLRFLLESAV